MPRKPLRRSSRNNKKLKRKPLKPLSLEMKLFQRRSRVNLLVRLALRSRRLRSKRLLLRHQLSDQFIIMQTQPIFDTIS